MHQTSITRAFLYDAYVQRRMSTWAIEKRYGISRSRVYNALKKYGIETRSIASSHIQYRRCDFSGDVCERAYILGFAIGDLRVREHNGERSETISIGCGSTKPAQIRLIERLFSRYGRVWKSTPNKRGVVNIEAFVNKSFSFLLPARRECKWCLEKRENFFAFLAGFTDAEGSFFISNNKACISWGNYDRGILAMIQLGLQKFGVPASNITSDSLKGYVGKHGYARSQNYHHLSYTQKEAVLKLVKELEPYIMHSDKQKALGRIKKNLESRGMKI